MIRVFSAGIRRLPHWEAFLEKEQTQFADSEVVVGWGHKPTAAKARSYAKAKHLPYVALEDGFLRSLDLGVNGAAPVSLTVDPVGVYYDATGPSQIETDIREAQTWFTPEVRDRARRCFDRIVACDLSKYNAAPSVSRGWLEATYPGCRGKEKILLIDQTRGDASVTLGLADESSFRRMAADARAEHPGAAFFVKTHPDVVAGKKAGYLTAIEEMTVISEPVTPLSFLSEFDAVYAVTSQMGFEALMLGKPVTLYGTPFYAGWGLTQDRGTAVPRRGVARDVVTVFAAAYLKNARYVNPVTGERFELEDAIDLLSDARRANVAHRGTIVCAGIRRWKKPHFRAFLSGTATTLQFIWDFDEALATAKSLNARLAVWAAKCTDGDVAKARKAGVSLLRVEDGFIRSIGLGSDYETPYSLVTDSKGIYYDPAGPSDLEVILNRLAGNPADYTWELARARRLRHFIVSRGITKYNLPVKPVRLAAPAGKRVVLVIGQVDGDASVVRGRGVVKTNAELLAAVREKRPTSYVVYLEHPDVADGNRPGQVDAETLTRCADEVLAGVPAAALLASVDEVHVLTSLTGFEALLRGIPVVTYGRPFYAGWGLTEDALAFSRRRPGLSIEGLTAGTLILYPTYWDWTTNQFCRPEDVCGRLSEGIQPNLPLWVRFVRQIRNLRRTLA